MLIDQAIQFLKKLKKGKVVSQERLKVKYQIQVKILKTLSFALGFDL